MKRGLIEIEKEKVEIPGVLRSMLYPFRDMEVGQSFFVPCEPGKQKKLQASISRSARRMRPTKFVTRTTPTGVRCWRIE